jgi:hypothetical protein
VLLNFHDTDPLDERIIGLSTEFEWQGKGVCPCRVGCGEPIITEKVIIDLSEITDMHGQEGGGQLNERFEHFRPWLLTQVGNYRTGIEAVGGRYAFPRRSSRAFSSCFRWANASLLGISFAIFRAYWRLSL